MKLVLNFIPKSGALWVIAPLPFSVFDSILFSSGIVIVGAPVANEMNNFDSRQGSYHPATSE